MLIETFIRKQLGLKAHRVTKVEQTGEQMTISIDRAVVKKVVFDEVQCSPHEFHNPVLDVCET